MEPTTINSWVQLGLGGAALGVLFLLVRQLITKLFEQRKSNGNGNGRAKAGEYPPEFWQLQLRAGVAEVVAPLLAQHAEILKGIAATQGMLATKMAVIESLVTRSVAANKSH